MKAKNYYPFPFFSGIVMLLTLLWLSVGISFVYLEQQQKEADKVCVENIPEDPDENTCPFDNPEEGSETFSNSFPSEYLQEDFEAPAGSYITLKHYKNRCNDAFIFFHVESFSPPPDPLS